MKKNKKAFTLIEIMISILILSFVLIAGFQLFSMALASKVKIVEHANLEKNIFYFSEKLFHLIKKGGTLDYEEYFNRNLVGLDIENGHYKKNTGFGNFGFGGNPGSLTALETNFGGGFYYCLSGDGNTEKLGRNGCIDNKNINSIDSGSGDKNKNYSGQPQRYGQYSFHFIDYNSNYDNDLGDENGDGKIKGDDDDSYLGYGPKAFVAGSDVKELYLLSGDKKKRTFIRWTLKQDESITDPSRNCIQNPIDPNYEYCRGTIEFLELEGKDWGKDHNFDVFDDLQNDGVIDTWVIPKRFTGTSDIIAGSRDDTGFRKELFSEDINITDFKVYAYPNIDTSKIWNIELSEQEKYLISPYVKLNLKVKPSQKIKSQLRGNVKEVEYSSTINLTDIFSN